MLFRAKRLSLVRAFRLFIFRWESWPAFLTTIRAVGSVVPHFSAACGVGGAGVPPAILAFPLRHKPAGETRAPPTPRPMRMSSALGVTRIRNFPEWLTPNKDE